jgi:nucleoside-diphosphate-sugar epimerase
MRIAVTGGMGKLGKAVVDDLLQTGHEVLVLDRVREVNSGHVRYLAGDIEDLGQVVGALAGCEAVIHLAGIPTHSVVANEVTFRVNTIGTFNVHEAASVLGIRRVVTMGSEAVLGWAPGSYQRLLLPEYLPIDENHPCRAQDCYGLSKMVCESIAKSYALKGGMDTVVLRAPWIVSAEELEALARSGGVAPTTFRLYHYVDMRDLAEACRLAVERPISGAEILFVGSGESVVREPLCELFPRLEPGIGDMASSLTGSLGPVCIDRAKNILRWAPRHSWRRA